MKHRAAALAFVILSVASRVRAADPPPDPVEIVYEADATCPSADEFTSDLLARTARARIARAGEQALTFEVTLRASGDGARGHLVTKTTDGRVFAREIDGPTCGEVAGAISLIAALAIDPRASTAPVVAKPPSAPPAPAPKTPVAAPAPVEVVPPAPAGPPTRWNLATGLEVTTNSGVAPGTLFVGRALFDASSSADSLWSPSLRLSAGSSLSTSFSVEGATSRFMWTTGRVVICPIRLGGGAITVRPCAEGGAGTLRASVTTHTRVRPWFDTGFLARADWVIGQPFSLETTAGGIIPIVRDSFSFDATSSQPRETVHHVSAIGFEGAIALVVRFP